MSTPAAAQVVTADRALRKLMDGNARFVKGNAVGPRRRPAQFKAMAEAQYPIAAVVACADSRVAPEILFDVGMGDIFDVRVAGNVISGAGATLKGSIEYAVAELNVPLIVVMGHSGCGAVQAACEQGGAENFLPGGIHDLIGMLSEAVIKSRSAGGDLLNNAIRENVRIESNGSEDVTPLLRRAYEGTLQVAGAFYDLSSGKVTLLD